MTDTTEFTPPTEQTPAKRKRRKAREPQAQTTNQQETKETATPRTTKAAIVQNLLSRKDGASLDDLCQATGWLPHTCRAFLTGLRKKGYAVGKEKREDGTTVYRLDAPRTAG